MVSLAALGGGDLVGAQQRVVDPAHDLGDGVGRVEALVGVGVSGLVGVGGDLPAGQVDGLQPGLHLLHRLAAGQRAEGVDVVALVQLPPQPLGAAPGQRVLLTDAAGQPDDVLGGVGALDAPSTAGRRPTAARAARPPVVLRLCHDLHRLHESRGLPMPPSACTGSERRVALCVDSGCGPPVPSRATLSNAAWMPDRRCRDLRRQGMNRARISASAARIRRAALDTLALAPSAINRGRLPSSANLHRSVLPRLRRVGEGRSAYAGPRRQDARTARATVVPDGRGAR